MKKHISILKEWRVAHRYSLWKLAVAVGVTVPTLARWEHGKSGLRAQNLLKLSEVTLIPLSTLSKDITEDKGE
jgi:transcriptional regulator with XRE-family HTH domain